MQDDVALKDDLGNSRHGVWICSFLFFLFSIFLLFSFTFPFSLVIG